MTTHANGRFYLTRDNDSHWYVVPTERANEWSEWLGLDPECDEAWDVPTFATPVGGSPSLVTFADPEVA